MKALLKILMLGAVIVLSGCGPFKYDSPRIMGLDQYEWYHLSQLQREIVVANQTAPKEKKLNTVCFKGCLRCCVPDDGSGSTGYNEQCFNQCLRSCTPVPREERFDPEPP